MLITNQSNTYIINRMETFETVLTPVRRNVARKSTANRPLLNTIIKDPLCEEKNVFIADENIISRQNDFTSHRTYKPRDFGLYFKDTSKRSLLKKKRKKYESFKDTTLKFIDSLDNSILHEESEEEDVNISGVFCVSDSMAKYIDESVLSPTTNYDSSDESIDLTKVKNYPIKLEKHCKSELVSEKYCKSEQVSDKYCKSEQVSDKYCKSEQASITLKDTPVRKSELGGDKDIKRELFCNSIEQPIISNDSVISDDSITELGIQTKKCLFDPNLDESVTCQVKVREEVLLCANVPLKMTILEANFDVANLGHLENNVDEECFNIETENEKDDISFVPQVICAMSLGNSENNALEETISTEPVEKQKKICKKPKKVSLKPPELTPENDSESVVNVKRMTRSQKQVNNTSNSAKRVTRNSTRLNPEPPVITDDVHKEEIFVNTLCDNEQHNENILNNESQKYTESNSVTNDSQPVVAIERIDMNSLDATKEDKLDCKKKCSLEKKGKKDINEGVLLHVEATKETELMRDGKIIKDKEEYLKDIESKIDQNLPVVVEKEFDIQQSLTEEILLDQALRLAHQRTSPRLSKIMKEAILKANVQKPVLKTKQPKVNNNNKIEMKPKGNKSLNSQKNSSDESETTDSTLNTSATSESASDVSFNFDFSNKDIEKKCLNENQQKRVKENYIIAPIIKKSNVENVVEPLTIKICRKNNKKKTGFRLSSKKKKPLKKKENIVSKPLCSSAVDMEDLSRTFEDILQDDSWCSDKLNIDTADNFTDNEENTFSSLEKKLSNSKIVLNLEDACDKSKQTLSTNKSIVDTETANSLTKNNNEVQPDKESVDSPIDCETEKPLSDKPEIIGNNETERKIKCNTFSDSIISVNVEDNSIDEEIPSKQSSSIPFLGDHPVSNKNMSPDTAPLHSTSTLINESHLENNLYNKKKDEVRNENNFEHISSSHHIDTISSNNDLKHTSVDLCSSIKSNTDGQLTPSPLRDTSHNPIFLQNAHQKTSDSLTTNNLIQIQSTCTESPKKNSLSLMNDMANKPLFSTNIVGKQTNQLIHQQINSFNHNSQIISNINQPYNGQIVNRDRHINQELATDQLNCPISAPNTDIGPKVLPLSIASRDPRLRKSHVRVIVEVSTSSVSNSLLEKPDIQQETRIVSHVMENFSREVDNRKEVDSDPEVSENQFELERKKKFRKREIDAELLYKTPLSDLHDVPERSSYTRSIRKRSPPKNDKRDPRNIRRNEGNVFQNADRVPETYSEYHEINMVYSKIGLQPVDHGPNRGDMITPDEYKRNDGFCSDYRKIERYRSESHYPDGHYCSYRNDEYPSDSRRENYIQNLSSEYINEVHSERHMIYQNHSDHRRLSYQHKETDQDHRRSENFPPENYNRDQQPDIYNRGYKRQNDFSTDHVHRDSPDYRDKELSRERVHERNSSHNEPSYSRWDYAHKKVLQFPLEANNGPKEEEEHNQPDNINMWQEERDIIDGPVKNFARPYYRRKKFARGEELFERRSAPWDVDNRRYNEDTDRNYERLWVRKTDNDLIHGPERDRWDRRGRKGFRDVREERSRSPRRDHDRFGGIRSRSPGSYLKSRKEASPSPQNSPLVLDSPMSPEPADRICVLEPTKCLTVPQ